MFLTTTSADSSLRDFYDERYKTDYMLTGPKFEEFRVRAVLSRIPRDVRSVLDYGCGQGGKIGLLREMFPNSEIFGVDISGNAVRKASKRFPQHQFVLFDGRVAPFPDRSFDLVFSWHVLEHVWNLEETVQDMSRLVRNGTYLCAILPCGNPGSVEEKVMRLVNGEESSKSREMRWIYEDEGHLRRIRSEELIRVFEKNGLSLLDESYALQSWDGVFHICSFAPDYVNRMFSIRRGNTNGDKIRIAVLKCIFLFGSLLFALSSVAHMDTVFYRISVKEWTRHNKEKNGSEQSLVFQKAEGV